MLLIKRRSFQRYRRIFSYSTGPHKKLQRKNLGKTFYVLLNHDVVGIEISRTPFKTSHSNYWQSYNYNDIISISFYSSSRWWLTVGQSEHRICWILLSLKDSYIITELIHIQYVNVYPDRKAMKTRSSFSSTQRVPQRPMFRKAFPFIFCNFVSTPNYLLWVCTIRRPRNLSSEAAYIL